jgi:hypothetical protein
VYRAQCTTLIIISLLRYCCFCFCHIACYTVLIYFQFLLRAKNNGLHTYRSNPPRYSSISTAAIHTSAAFSNGEYPHTPPSQSLSVSASHSAPRPVYGHLTLLETRGQIDPSSIVSSIFGLRLGLI